MTKPQPSGRPYTRWLRITYVAFVPFVLVGYSYLPNAYVDLHYAPGLQHLSGHYADGLWGGEAESQWLDKANHVVFCNIPPDKDFSICGLSLKYADADIELSQLNDAGDGFTGFDLTQFSKLRFEIIYRGPNDALRLYFRNDEDRFEALDDEKFMEIPIHVIQGELQVVEVSLADFIVAPWWINQKNIPDTDADLTMDNVKVFGVDLLSPTVAGKHYISVRNVQGLTKRIPVDQLKYFLMGYAFIIVALELIFCIFRHLKNITGDRARLVELQQVNGALQEQVYKDSLTRVLNRAGIEHLVSQRQLFEGANDVTILLLDIDHFKQVNDNYGHEFGDVVLQRFAQILKECVAGQHYVGRWGGEEFVILSTGFTLREGQALAEMVRLAVSQERYEYKNISLAITTSIGVSEWPTTVLFAEALAAADRALYRAKSQGRNCVNAA